MKSLEWKRGTRSGLLTCAVAGLLSAFGAPHAVAGVTRTISGAAPEPATWLEEMDAYFEANPELKARSGSGYKPFGRIKWAYERNLVDGLPPEPGARLKAWERKMAAQAAMPAPRNTWFFLGPTNAAGRMLAVDFDPNDASIVYAGAADGGVWKTTDGGSSWFPLTDEMPVLAVGGLAVSKTNPGVIVIGTGEGSSNGDRVSGIGIWRSTDAGATWAPTSMVVPEPSGYGLPGHGFHFVECGPNGTFLAGATDGLYRSTDDGATWTAVKSGPQWYDARWKPGDPNRVYTVRGASSTGSGVKTSTDDGLTWSYAGPGQPLAPFIGKSKLGVSGNTVYCLMATPSSGAILDLIKSTDDGNHWVSMGAPSVLSTEGQAWYNLVCAADPNNADVVLCGGQQLGRSGDGGVTFRNVRGSSLYLDQHAVKYEPGSNFNVWIANDGGMYRSPSDGSAGSWVSRNGGLVTFQFYDICVNNGPTAYYALGGTQDRGTDRWSGTTAWSLVLGGDGGVCNIAPTNGTTVYAERERGQHHRSLDSGGSFASIDGGLTGNGAWVAPVAVSWFNADHVLTSTTDGIFRSVDGTSWSNVAGHPAVWIDYSPVDGNHAWTASTPSEIYTTTDNGTSWIQASPIPFPVGGGVRKVLAHPTQLGSAFVTFSGYTTDPHIVVTTDFGSSWTDVSGDFSTIGAQPVNAIAVDPSNPHEWYIGTDVGVWHSGNDGATWLPWETGLPNAVVLDLEIADGPRKLVAGTHGRGAWEIDLPATGTDAAVSAPQQPLNLMLDAPSPNPARGRTMLRYAAKSVAPVSLRMYDVHGRLVSDLESFASGDGVIRTTPWLTGDVPSGVYFAVLQAGADRITRKITVLE